MAVRKFKPTTPGQRHKIIGTFEEITASVPEKSLVYGKKSSGGRNSEGKMTMRYIGGGHRKVIRIVDFKRNKDGVPAVVKTIEYDPNRSARIALLFYADGEKRYILAPKGLKKGDIVSAGSKADIKPGNALKLKDMPVGVQIHNVELQKGKGGQLVRSAGTAARLVAKEGTYCHVELPSGELRLIHGECMATVGEVGNSEHNLVSIGKAGRARHMGKRPHVRGAVMNPVDHPHGGGEGKNSVGRKSPLTPWGKPALGIKTRGRKTSDKFIVRRRNEK